MQVDDLGRNLEQRRKQSGLSLRELGRRAGMSPGALSAIERGRSSPTLATLHKLLRALGSDFAQFFTAAAEPMDAVVFRKGQQTVLEDKHRRYRFLFVRRSDLRFEMLQETVAPTERKVEWEAHDCDLGGVVLSGGPVRLEVDAVGRWTLRRGDSFYIKAGQKHRAVNLGKSPLHMVTVFDPPRY